MINRFSKLCPESGDNFPLAPSGRTWLCSVADPEGGTSGHGPPSKLAMEFGTLGGRKRNHSIVNLSKSKDVAPPYRRRLRIWPPSTEKYHIKTLKRSMTKKSHKYLGDR